MNLLPNKIELAKMIATQAHANQRYGKLLPYMYHVNLVVSFIEKYVPQGYAHRETLIIAAYLHDTVEDSTISYNAIGEIFGVLIADIVWAVTGQGKNRKERNADAYSKIKKIELAKILKMGDRGANLLHSKAFNKDKIAMYRKEHLSFLKGIEIDISNDPLVAIFREELTKLIAE